MKNIEVSRSEETPTNKHAGRPTGTPINTFRRCVPKPKIFSKIMRRINLVHPIGFECSRTSTAGKRPVDVKKSFKS